MHQDKRPATQRFAEANMDAMYRIFTVPEAPGSTLGQIDNMISQNLMGFLQNHIVAVEKDLSEVEKDFADAHIPEKPWFVSDQTQFLLDKLVAQSVHTASPSFVGHMTSALPYFMLPLSRIMMALNQNLVKIETSKAFTPLERQVLGMMHRLIYERDDKFYDQWMHKSGHSLGVLCSGGTIANMTALWVARNAMFKPSKGFKGINHTGVFGALKHHGLEGMAVLVSERGHYSLAKAADVLGIGRDHLLTVRTDDNNKVNIRKMRQKLEECRSRNIGVMAIVGVCGTSETGTVDPLNDLADLAEEFGCHYHVDAAWGGATLFSQKYSHILEGIRRADSVTIDGHKQLYVPMGAGMVFFKNPTALSNIQHHAEYIIRQGSKDLGSHTLEGSRPGMAMLVHSGLRIIGRSGYEILINEGIEKARAFADMVRAEPDFEMITEPELNILTYRYVPEFVKKKLATANAREIDHIHDLLNRLTKLIQKTQRARGKSFVSRTRLTPEKYGHRLTVVFRVVLANPLTNHQILRGVLEEQRTIASLEDCQQLLRQLSEACAEARHVSNG
ncbi:Putative glutamate decarboxylase [gamma proteobacterium HdN1]|nr:Putative glutamate decarboxylase [gamma proteobacterium HdN1]